MNPSLQDFFNEEKKRVLTPDPNFTTRVMARLREFQNREFSIWDVIPGSVRPVMGLALMLILAFVAIQLFVPQLPEQGFITGLLEVEGSQSDAPFLYGAELPADHELLNQLMGFEDR